MFSDVPAELLLYDFHLKKGVKPITIETHATLITRLHTVEMGCQMVQLCQHTLLGQQCVSISPTPKAQPHSKLNAGHHIFDQDTS